MGSVSGDGTERLIDMFFWIREILGWALVVVGLLGLWKAIDFVSDPEAPRIIEAGVFAFAAMGLVRVGILLIRISTAARICVRENSPAVVPAVAGKQD